MDMHIPAELRAGTTLPPVTATNDAEPLQALWDRYRRAVGQWSAAEDTLDKAKADSRKHHPKRDTDFYVTFHGGNPAGTPAMEHELVALAEGDAKTYGFDSPEARESRERVERFGKWNIACEAVDVARGVPVVRRPS